MHLCFCICLLFHSIKFVSFVFIIFLFAPFKASTHLSLYIYCICVYISHNIIIINFVATIDNLTRVNSTPYNNIGCDKGRGGGSTSQQRNWSQEEMDAMEIQEIIHQTFWEQEVKAKVEEVEVLPSNTTRIGMMKRWWPWIVVRTRSTSFWNKLFIHEQTRFLQCSGGTSY